MTAMMMMKTLLVAAAVAVVVSIVGLIFTEPIIGYYPDNENYHRQLRVSLFKFTDPKSTFQRHASITEDNNNICIANVDDGRIATASVMDENGNVELALPMNYETTYTLECIGSNQETGIEEVLPTSTIGTISGAVLPPPSASNCDRKNFQPGYYDQSTNVWHDHCTGHQTSIASASLTGQTEKEIFSKEQCPLVAANGKKDVWVSIIGDSVTRQVWIEGMRENGIRLRPHEDHWSPSPPREWHNGRMPEGQIPLDFSLYKLGDSNIWISYTLDYLTNHKTMNWEIPYTWGDFMMLRGEGPTDQDPTWPVKRTPDMVFLSPGYHASPLDEFKYGEGVEKILTSWQHKMDKLSLSMPQIHLVLNMMPAPWLIPDKYEWDKSLRTRARTYKKNLAIIETAKQFAFVDSVVDFFSIELPFNGYKGNTSHKDAVHFGDKRMLKIIADRVIYNICHSFGNDVSNQDNRIEDLLTKIEDLLTEVVDGN